MEFVDQGDGEEDAENDAHCFGTEHSGRRNFGVFSANLQHDTGDGGGSKDHQYDQKDVEHRRMSVSCT